jgi:hypothetical protein
MKDNEGDGHMYVTRASDEGKCSVPTMGIFDALALVWMLIADFVLGIEFRLDERARKKESKRHERNK